MLPSYDPMNPMQATRPQRPASGYNPVGSFRSTFKPLTQATDDPNKPKPLPTAGQTAQPQQPPQVQPAQAPQAAPAPQPTFAQMQAAGQARPAPPPPPPVQQPVQGMQALPAQMQTAMQTMSPVPSGAQSLMSPPSSLPGAPGSQGSQVYTAPVQTPSAGNPNQSALNASILQALQNPSAYGTPQVMDAFTRMSQNIDDEFTQKNAALKEEMARRGLSDSTINSGRGYSLNVEQRSAKTDLAQQLLDKMAQTYGSDRAAAISAGLAQGDLGLRDKLGTGELDLNRQKVTGDLNNANLDRQLRERLGLGELDINRARTENDLTLGKNQLLGSIFNTLANSNFDLSSLPPGFFDLMMGQMSGGGSGSGSGSSSGGGSTGGGASLPPGYTSYPSGGNPYTPATGGGSAGGATGGTSGGSVGGGSSAPITGTPGGGSITGPTYDPTGHTFAGSNGAVLDYNWLQQNSLPTGSMADTYRPDALTDQSRALAQYLAGDYFDPDINRGYQDPRQVAASLGQDWNTFTQNAAQLGVIYDDQGRLLSQPDRRVTMQDGLAPDGNVQAFLPRYFPTDLTQYPGGAEQYFQGGAPTGKSYGGFLDYLKQQMGGG